MKDALEGDKVIDVITSYFACLQGYFTQHTKGCHRQLWFSNSKHLDNKAQKSKLCAIKGKHFGMIAGIDGDDIWHAFLEDCNSVADRYCTVLVNILKDEHFVGTEVPEMYAVKFVNDLNMAMMDKDHAVAFINEYEEDTGPFLDDDDMVELRGKYESTGQLKDDAAYD